METIKDIILLLKSKNADQFLTTCSDFSERGFMYEALWNIVIKFNCLPNVSIKKHIKSNLNKRNKIYLTDFSKDFLDKKFRSGNSSGYSDITFKDNTGNLYISTVKYFENETGKQRDDWDLPKLAALYTIHEKAKCLVFTKDKKTFEKIYNNSNKNDIHLIENVYDLTDLNECLANVVKILNTYEWNFDKLLQFHFGNQKSYLKLLFHQELCLENTSSMRTNEPILWGLKCRSGKSYIMAGHILKNNFSNVLIITPIPNESIKALVKLFEQYIEFDGYKVIHFQRSTKIPECEKKIIIASKQFLDGKNIAALKDINFDVVYSDENHWGGTTKNSKNIVSTYVKNTTQFVTLTATYFKSQHEWNISNEQSFFWDLEDEVLCKQNNIEELIKKFGSNVKKVLANHDLKSEYNEMPLLTLLSVLFDPVFIAKFKQFNTDDSYSFDTTALLKCDNNEFLHKTHVKELIDYHFGDGLNNGKNMMDRIRKYDTRTGKEFHTQLWFLPYGSGNNLDETAKCMKALIESHKYGKKFAVEILTSKNDNSETGNLFEYIQSLENNAKEESKQGLILLLGFKCSMGISLPLADVVVLLNNGESMDMYIQMMMRSMTENRGTNKKRGFVIDYNQKRVLQTAANIIRRGTTVKEDIKKCITNEVVHIDEDMYVDDKTKVLDKIYEIWNNTNQIDLIRSRLERLSSIEFDKEDYKRISEYMKNVSIQKETKEKIEVNSDDEKLPDGSSDTEKNDDNSSKKEEYEEEEIKINYGKELLTYIPFILGLLTHKQKQTADILECLEFIKQKKDLYSIFMFQCQVWWDIKNTPGFIELLMYLIKKYYLNIINDINNVIEDMKNKITNTSLLDDKKGLLDMLNSRLTPKDVEKRKYGEVFTPLEWVEKMLDLLPKEIWSDETKKWYDPACGIGNFPVCIYYRLMDGLKNKIKDTQSRKDYIIKNMLYMSELNSKNVFIIKTIFGDDCNVYEGDSMEFQFKTYWNLNNDNTIIIGNPPYNKELTRSGASPFYNEFIEKFIDQCLYLLFIVPSRWFSGGKGLDKFREKMLSRTDIEKIINIPNSKTVFGNGVDIEGGVNYFLKNSNYKGLCDVNGCLLMLNQFDVLIDTKYQTIINKVLTYTPLVSLYQGRCFGIETNDKRLCDDNTLVKCYVSKARGFVKYIDKTHVTKDFNFWKVIAARANGKSKCFGNVFVGSPNEVHTGTYISFKVNSENEAKSLESFMKSKLSNFLLGLRKSSQAISEFTCKWIPLPPLDRTWSDEDVYKYFKLTKEEIDMIEKF